MAVYNEIGIGRWNRFIQKLTDMKGGPPARQLSSEIAFQHEIFSGQEVRWLQGWDRFGVGLSVGAIAAQFSSFRLRNPPGSNIIAVIEKALVSKATAGLINFEYGTPGAADLSNISAVIEMETRGRNASSCIASFNAAAPTQLNNVLQVSIPANTPFDCIADEEVVIPPGGAIQMQTQTVNEQGSFSVWWRERFLEPPERF